MLFPYIFGSRLKPNAVNFETGFHGSRSSKPFLVLGISLSPQRCCASYLVTILSKSYIYRPRHNTPDDLIFEYIKNNQIENL